MEATINKVQLQGFLGQDAEVRTFDSERTLITLRMATNESYKNTKSKSKKRAMPFMHFCRKADKHKKLLSKPRLQQIIQ